MITSKPLPTDFLKRGNTPGKGLGLPMIIVTRDSRSSVPASKIPSTGNTAFSVDSLDKLITAFQNNERTLPKG